MASLERRSPTILIKLEDVAVLSIQPNPFPLPYTAQAVLLTHSCLRAHMYSFLTSVAPSLSKLSGFLTYAFKRRSRAAKEPPVPLGPQNEEQPDSIPSGQVSGFQRCGTRAMGVATCITTASAVTSGQSPPFPRLV